MNMFTYGVVSFFGAPLTAGWRYGLLVAHLYSWIFIRGNSGGLMGKIKGGTNKNKNTNLTLIRQQPRECQNPAIYSTYLKLPPFQ